MEIAVVSDTHVPSREPAIPRWVVERMREADHVFHAGDFDAPRTLDRIRDLASDLTAVAGNVDGPAIDCPEIATVELGGVEFVLAHGSGRTRDHPERVASTIRARAGADVVGVTGHTHEPLDRVVDGVRLLNPGSATGARPADRETTMTVDVADGELDVEIHER